MSVLSFEGFVLNEGGKVFKHETRRVSATEARATAEHLKKVLFPKLGLNDGGDIIQVGSSSVGKDAGDIDFAYDIQEMRTRLGSEDAERRFFDRLRMETGYKAELIKGFGITSLEYPIAGEKDKGYVQVDFIPVEGMAWAKFTYEQPKHSKYKSAHRNWLLAAMCAARKEDVKEVEGETLAWTGYMFDIQRGFFKIRKTREGTMPGKILKNPKKEESTLISTNPEKFIEFAFTEEPEVSELASFEDVWRIIINDPKWKSIVKTIAKELEKFLVRAELVVPDEIKEFL